MDKERKAIVCVVSTCRTFTGQDNLAYLLNIMGFMCE